MADEVVVIEKRCVFCPEAQVVDIQPLLRTCPKCSRVYCSSHASSADPQFCQDCLSDVIVKDETVVKTEEEWDLQKDQLIRHTQKFRQIEFHGTGWMFYTKAIHGRSDDELKAFIEYHRALVSLIEHEIIDRKIQKSKLQIKVNGQYTSLKKSTEKREKTTVRQKKFDPSALAAQLKAMGITPEMMANIMKAQNKAQEIVNGTGTGHSISSTETTNNPPTNSTPNPKPTSNGATDSNSSRPEDGGQSATTSS
jgi:hypothetical protein